MWLIMCMGKKIQYKGKCRKGNSLPKIHYSKYVNCIFDVGVRDLHHAGLLWGRAAIEMCLDMVKQGGELEKGGAEPGSWILLLVSSWR